MWAEHLTQQAFEGRHIHRCAQDAAPGGVVGHSRVGERKQMGQFCGPQLGPVCHSADLVVPAQFGKHRKREHQRQRIAHAAPGALVDQGVEAGIQAGYIDGNWLSGEQRLNGAHGSIHRAPFLRIHGSAAL